ncbi:MAG: uncharacterized protein PWP31_48 [Clostridia bacterium]|nr:uncharacterized protein [Clostridia bacterium]
MKDKITKDMKEALKNKDKIKLQTLRMVLSSIKNEEINKQKSLSDEEILQVIQRETKMRKDSLEQFTKGGRDDLADQTKRELEILEGYLPKQLTEDELRSVIEETINEVGAESNKEMGKVMGALMPKIRGKADGKLANKLVKEMLS